MSEENEMTIEFNGKKLYTTEFMAKLFGVTPRRVNQLAQEDIITCVKVGRAKRAYDLVPTIKGYITYLQERTKKRESTEEEEQLKKDKLRAEIRLKDSQYELHQLRTEIQQGKYLPVADVQLDYQRFFAVFKKFAQAVPSRLITRVANYIDPVEARALEKDMSREVADMLRTFVVAGESAGGKK